MNRTAGNWETDFPLRDEVEDFSGKLRTFVITCFESGLGFTVRAEEAGAKGEGYEFSAFSETSPYSALGRVRQKMHLGLATRHLTGAPGERRMLHEKLSGRITSDGKGGAILVVDGIPLSIEEFGDLLQSQEGCDFKMRIVSGLE